MYREIMNDLPLRLVKPNYSTDARRQLTRYAEGAKRMIESRGTSAESRKVVKWHAEDALEWVRRQRNASYEDLLVCAVLPLVLSLVSYFVPWFNVFNAEPIDRSYLSIYEIDHGPCTLLRTFFTPFEVGSPCLHHI